MAKKSAGNQKAKFGDSFGGFVLAVLCILGFRWAFFEPFVIPSGSMIPTLLIHDHILVSKMAYGLRIPFTKRWLFRTGEPKHGDIVVFKSIEDSNYFMIKRVIGLPGDVVDVSPEGMVSVNGKPLEVKALDVTEDPSSQAPYYQINEGDLQGRFSDFQFLEEKLGEHTHRALLVKDYPPRGGDYKVQFPFTVPSDQYFCMGDNRDNSRDSRYWSTLPRENLLGKALFVWLSCEETLPYIQFICNPLELRWRRFFHVLK